MVINMDSELQRLICVSVEKMTREPVTSRKGKGLDLRKALLVAHVLQDMRTAYIADDYRILVNTVCPEKKDDKLERSILRKEYNESLTEDVFNHKKRKFLSDDWATGSIERPPRSESGDNSFMTTPYRCPSGTQSCVPTCSDAMMSKISQITHPIPVSINTTYILSHQTDEKGDDVDMETDTPSVAEQVEVTSDNELDVETVESEVIQCEEMLNNGPESPKIIMDTTTVTTYTDLSDSQRKIQTVSCPLPRKKRPLPKEFLEIKAPTELDCKKAKFTNLTVTSTPCEVTVTSSPCRLLNTTTATTVTQSTALSCTKAPSLGCGSQSSTPLCSTVTSSVSTNAVVSSVMVTSSSTDSKAKVVVEMMHKSAWTWSLPSTCTKPKLSQRFIDDVYRSQLIDVTNLRENNSVHTLGLNSLVTV